MAASSFVSARRSSESSRFRTCGRAAPCSRRSQECCQAPGRLSRCRGSTLRAATRAGAGVSALASCPDSVDQALCDRVAPGPVVAVLLLDLGPALGTAKPEAARYHLDVVRLDLATELASPVHQSTTASCLSAGKFLQWKQWY